MSDQQYSRVQNTKEDSSTVAEPWRNEIQARVAGYKNRRGRRVEGAFSMRFPFPPADAPFTEADTLEVGPIASAAMAPEATPPSAAPPSGVIVEQIVETAAMTVSAPEPEQPRSNAAVAEQGDGDAASFALSAPAVEEQPRVSVPLAPRPRPRRKIIAFPRQATVSQENPYVLADPVFAEQPRILDVPEELAAVPATPFLEGLHFDPVRGGQPPVAEEDGQDQLPTPPAELSLRLEAAAIDLAVIAAGYALFGVIAYRMLLGTLVIGKPLLAGAVLIPAVLWSAYEYLFLVYAGRTVGMQVTHIGLSTFGGRPARRSQRRTRVFGLYLSAMSLGMGALWAFIDADALCWQDRVSRTYPVRRS